MQIDLPASLATRIRDHAAHGSNGNRLSEAEVVARALDLYEAEQREIAAIQEGIDDWRAGRVRDFAEFDREFREKNGIPADNQCE